MRNNEEWLKTLNKEITPGFIVLIKVLSPFVYIMYVPCERADDIMIAN